MTNLQTFRSPSFIRSVSLCFGLALCLSQNALAGTIFFSLEQDKGRLSLTNQGSDSAFYAQVFRLRADGEWEALATAPDQPTQAELPSAATMRLLWPALPSAQQGHPFASLRPVMVRYFDQAGSSLGQISFFTSPPLIATPLNAEYHKGLLRFQPPAEAGSAWLLWPQEEGIAPLASPLRFEHQQPPARQVVWEKNGPAQAFSLGAGEPAAMLLAKSANGLELQILASGGLRGSEQRARWLNGGSAFDWLACGLLVAALLALTAHTIRVRRNSGAPS